MRSTHLIPKDILQGFSKANYAERVQKLLQAKLLDQQQIDALAKAESFGREQAELLIENVIGTFTLPLGIAVNFVINQKDYIIPMAIEESSVIASASKTAKWIKDQGKISASNLSWLSVGQIQWPKVKDFKTFEKKINQKKSALLDDINQNIAANMVKRGGGARDLIIRRIPRKDGYSMAVVHILVDCCDAMGANIINQICEGLKPQLEALTSEKIGLCILSNLPTQKITRAEVVIYNMDPEVGKAIEEASLFASLDPYRAATNNKGIMNAIDGLLIATGNDWRAVEAGVHAYAARHGMYESLTHWYMQGKNLHGEFEAPIDVGVVGGVTKIHPTAQACLQLLKVSSAQELAEIVAAAGLVQNLAALRALCTEGIIRGHMLLHANNLFLTLGATQSELPSLNQELKQHLMHNKKMSSLEAQKIIDKIRSQAQN